MSGQAVTECKAKDLSKTGQAVNGLVHVYAGDGKGKTTAAIGLCTRISGYGKKAAFYEFLKGNGTGEAKALPMLGVEFYCPIESEKFVFTMSPDEKLACVNRQIATLNKALTDMKRFDLIVLDEVLSAIEVGVLDVYLLIELIKLKPLATELVLTGRVIPDEVAPYADYISVITSVKHPYNEGVVAREGIEY